MKFCTLMGKKHKQKLIGSHGTHMHCRTALIRLGPTLYTDADLGLNQHKPPILIRGSYSNFPVNANSTSVYSLFIVIFCVHVSVNIFRSRRQKSGFLTLGVQKGQNTCLFLVWEKMLAMWEFYTASEKSLWLRRVRVTFQGEVLHLRIFTLQISSTTWKQIWGRIKYLLKNRV